MIFSHILQHSLIYALLVNGFLLIMMVSTSPRVWGYSDYSDEIKAKVPPQTVAEKRLALLMAIPWLIFTFWYPIYATNLLKAELGGQIPFSTAFLGIFSLLLATSLVDLVVLDWLIVSKITPNFVMIPGTTKADYQDFSHHYKAQAKAVLPLAVIALIIAAFIA